MTETLCGCHFAHRNCSVLASIFKAHHFGVRAGTGPVIVHWNGRSWRRVLSPNIPFSACYDLGGIELTGVSAVSAQDIWAVSVLRIEHWDGRNWRIVRSPQGASGVAAISSHNVWAVGSHGYETLIQHWDGIRWGIFPSPNTNL
jgi:hypothetical protein